jgi:TolB-like protein
MNKLLGFIPIIIYIGCASMSSGPDELDLAIRDASDYLNDNIPEESMIVILNVQSDSAALSDYIIDELIANAVNDRIFKVVDRQQLDLIRTEQNFQLSGEVDDNLALSIGKFLGAQTIVSGRVSQVADRYRMTIRALEVQTAQVQGQYNRNMTAGKTITALMRSGGGSGGGKQAASAKSGSGTSGKAAPAVTGVTVSPDNVSVDKGKTQQFEAAINGTNNPYQTVTWTVTGNTNSKTTISEDGILTVADDEIATPLIVTATSTVDQSKNGMAAVIVPGGIAALIVNNVSTWSTAVNNIRNGGNNQTYIINVTGNISVPSTSGYIFGSVTGITVTIQGSGTLTLSASGRLLNVRAGQTVIVRNVTLRGRSNDTSMVYIGSGGVFRMEGSASVTGNSGSSRGGGVFVDGGTFIMKDRTSVTGNTARGSLYETADGGGVYIKSGTCIMQENASITGNTASKSGYGGGGGVYVNSGTFTMESGTISGNSGVTYAGGVYIYVGGTFTMKGGIISSNIVSDYYLAKGGGGVYIAGGTFTMEGGTISGNTAAGLGGGVYNGSGEYNMREGTFNMRGGVISGNSAGGKNGFGGGVFIDKGDNFTKTGGTVSGNDLSFGERNNASMNGHAIYLDSYNTNRWRNATAGPNDNTGSYGFWLND